MAAVKGVYLPLPASGVQVGMAAFMAAAVAVPVVVRLVPPLAMVVAARKARSSLLIPLLTHLQLLAFRPTVGVLVVVRL